MEFMLHYAWQHRIFPLHELKTSDGDEVEVISTGKHNTDAGPDFIGAQVKIGANLWVGNVEIHVCSSDWYRHQHETNPAYDNVILHVVSKMDCEVCNSKGDIIPQMLLEIPDSVMQNYEQLVREDRLPRCRKYLSAVSRLTVTSWLSALFVERLEQRTNQIMERRELCNMNWEDTAFVTIARNFGFGKNGDAFEQWAMSIPMSAVSKHRNDLFQIEAIFFGQAGLLDDSMLTPNAIKPDYFVRLQKEYQYLSKKFSLKSIDPVVWKFLRLRPQNFPHIRIAQLAMLYYSNVLNLSKILNAETIDDLHVLLQSHVSDFWLTHYSFSSEESGKNMKNISISSKNLIVINSVVPLLFAYGRYKSDESMCQKAVEFMEMLKPEKNHIITSWAEAGIDCSSAADSQALIQLTRRYCETKDCLRCRFGYEYIKHTPDFLKENEI